MALLLTPTKSYVTRYPEAIQFAEAQERIFWTANEIDVSKDIMDLRVHMSEAERHGVITTLKLFTLYELVAGDEYWLGKVIKTFQRPEIQRMAATFGFFELNVHAPFYSKINKELMLDDDEFYLGYVKDETLKERMEFIGNIVDDPNHLFSLAVFSLVEGAVLYSSFAFLKHFQAKGKNKLLNVVRGINFSVRDENLHSEAGAWLYKALYGELTEGGTKALPHAEKLSEAIVGAARAIYEHEARIVDMIFEKGEMEGITSEQMKTFVKSRINLCLERLGVKPIFEVSNNIIADWFYDNINAVSLHDFFSGVGNSYNRNWDEKGFTW
ncbi:Ribonucleoside-diphosphate reductase subunit beta [compost metagenome]